MTRLWKVDILSSRILAAVLCLGLIAPSAQAAGPAFSLSPGSLNFSTPAPGSNPASQNVVVSNTGDAGSTLSWTCLSNPGWIALSASSGNLAAGGSQTIQVSIAGSAMGSGTYTGVLIFSDSNASNNPQTVPITFVVGGNADGSTVLTGPADVRVYPNPWRADGNATPMVKFDQFPDGSSIKIFTLSGRLVKKLETNVNTATWDLTNSNGKSVASGLYIYLVEDGHGGKARGKLAIVR
jgi:hypothetical protein